jgi:hypothetical protein
LPIQQATILQERDSRALGALIGAGSLGMEMLRRRSHQH